uniref:Uncharacterized protein LOC102807287 n=1 Tax=Saccoglossus kowalevskii TaxID=10224 RepID=A0ABM0MQC8_SACKO|nr:PREDICTED: uncharacterized protein LOC102807287 [Saccoglossus kowalevskii]
MTVNSQSTSGQAGVTSYQHHCKTDNRCQYTVTLPDCGDEENCNGKDNQPALTDIIMQLSYKIDQQNEQIATMSDKIHNLTEDINQLNEKLGETWGAWSSCDVTCGGGTRVRYTTNSSETYQGHREQISSCGECNCPEAATGLVSINSDGYDITDPHHYEAQRSVLSWYPYEGTNKKTCFIKILVDSCTNARFRVISSGGGHPAVGNQQYGIREDSSKPKPPDPLVSTKTAACIEFKCSGLLRTGHPELDIPPLGEIVSGGADMTQVNITAVTTTCQLKTGSDGVNPSLLSYIQSYGLESDIQQGDASFQFKVPDGSTNGPTTGIYVAQGEGMSGYDNAFENCLAGDDYAYIIGTGDNPDNGWALQYECY